MQDTHRLTDLLVRVRQTIPDGEFCGVGLIVYSEISELPILDLCARSSGMRSKDLVHGISSASRSTNKCHDGFHLISCDWRLTHTNQYFAPPIPAGFELRETLGIGARHASALLGSLLPSVICSGVFTGNDTLIVFQNGSICVKEQR